MFVSCAGLAFFLDIACFGEADLGEEGTDDFINENGKEGNIANDIAFSAKLGCLDRHTERNARLRKKGDAEVFYDVGVAFCCSCADACAEILTERTRCDINDTDEYNGEVCEYGEIKLCAADNEEENEDRSYPSVRSFHEFFGEVTEVAECSTEHHAGKERGEADVNGADVEFEAGDGNGHQNESDGNRHTLGSGVEEAFAECEEKTHDEAEHEGENNFKKRFENDGKDIDGACADGFCNTEGDRKYDKTDRVVERYDRKQDIGNGTLCLVLLNDHEGCGGSGRGRNSAENECRGKGKLIGHCEMERDEYAVYQKTSEDCLENTDYGSLFTDFFKRCKSKFVTDGKRDKAE